ncbi:hypothetical protein BT93_L1149 [Corymbia citriodora subsp. variegata]|uniref:Uncharacterized protein n=1 Tax=Corymbia citriodora subsp. variegata TaxID=360336 RepID=A0A8T0CQY9_CORYI|nr:hypothetical protein BT93_L1149 [Corymbia citriodora subsp. variegata]
MGDLGNTGTVSLRAFIHATHAIILTPVFSGHLFMIALFPFCISITALPNQSVKGKYQVTRFWGSMP